MEENKQSLEISDLGEFGLIERLTTGFPIQNESTILGVGDDAAVLKYSGKFVITTDLLLEGVHFDLVYTPMRHLGYKSVMVNLSDVCAMFALPKQITVSIAISSKISLQMIDDFYLGVKLACEKHGVDLVGGDTTTSLTGFTISITAIGEPASDAPVCRNTASANDLICVSGDLGAAYMGLLVLEREKEVFKVNPHMQPDFSGCDYILERFLKPEARVDIVKSLHEAGLTPTSMIDVSDGLSSELFHLCKGSNTGCKIFADRVPVDFTTSDVARELNHNSLTCSLHGGEDYELLFTIPVSQHEKILSIPGVTVIGHMCSASEGLMVLTPEGRAIELKAQGWNHMKSNQGSGS